MKIGYARVSTQEQNLNVQLEQLNAIGCEKIYQEQASGKSLDREQLNNLLEFAREGDVIHVTKVDRIARNTIDALQIADRLAEKKAGLVFHDLGDLDINSDVGRVIYTTISPSQKWKENASYSAVMRVGSTLEPKEGTSADFLIRRFTNAFKSLQAKE
ncbi:Putative transposon DNA-invertase bin3 (plasmid) [Vibrio scophthalmi]|nr:Putative transposon DNA-invertase bin3 [Vibrio scophthalmi]